SGQGGFGFGDGDDVTIVPNTALSVYIRKTFTVSNPTDIIKAILHADYDDAFVAYINGIEIARSSIGTVGIEPAFNEPASGLHEAVMYNGGRPEEYILYANDLSSILLTGTNVLTVQIHNQSTTSSDMSGLFYLSFGIESANTYFSPVPSWFIPPFVFESSNLPIIKINTNGLTIPNEPRIVANMGIVDNGVGVRNYVNDLSNNYNGRIEIETRGSSSQGFPKKSYRIETQDNLGLNNNVELLGMPAENDWVLYAPYTDKSLIRNILAYEMGRWTNKYAPRTRLCELVINNSYQGVYVLMENIKKDSNRVDISTLQPIDVSGDEVTGGYIFKVDRADPQGGGWNSSFPTGSNYTFYQIVYPRPVDIQPQQFSYIQNYMYDFESMVKSGRMDDPINGFQQYADLNSFIDFFIVNEVSKNVDGYRLSAFFYKEKITKGGKLFAGPLWDFNLGYGNADYCEGDLYTGWAYLFNKICGDAVPFYWESFRKSELYVSRLKSRWQELRAGKFHNDSVANYIDSLALVLDEAQVRNYIKWPILGSYVWPNSFIGNTYQDEIQFLKDWTIARMEYMDGQIEVMEPLLDYNALKAYITQVYPNPFNHTTTIKYALHNPGEIKIDIYNNTGQKIKTLDNEWKDIGYYEQQWDGTDESNGQISSGLYFAIITFNGKVKSVNRIAYQ
ncbi:MAG: CotH kinase family protein, partial [Cyclobacteriaceae bacterium]|nr:CotH kinase family protein [Cyclobacteriaceae bacterium]